MTLQDLSGLTSTLHTLLVACRTSSPKAKVNNSAHSNVKVAPGLQLTSVRNDNQLPELKFFNFSTNADIVVGISSSPLG